MIPCVFPTNCLIAFLYTFCFSSVFCSFNTTTTQPFVLSLYFFLWTFLPCSTFRWHKWILKSHFYWLWSFHTLLFSLLLKIMYYALCLLLTSNLQLLLHVQFPLLCPHDFLSAALVLPFWKFKLWEDMDLFLLFKTVYFLVQCHR